MRKHTVIEEITTRCPRCGCQSHPSDGPFAVARIVGYGPDRIHVACGMCDSVGPPVAWWVSAKTGRRLSSLPVEMP